jgi:glycine/D-amino acid oxidase-like deaminating enzyme
MKKKVFWKNPGYKIRPKLKKDIECDYLIIGGGVTGVSLAYFLNKLGAKSVVLIEKNFIASGATGMAAGSLVIRGELDFQDIIKRFGVKKGRDFWRVNHEGLRTIKEIIKKEKIECDYNPEDTIYGSLETDHYFVFEEYLLEKDLEKSTELIVGEQLKQNINTSLYKYAVLSRGHGVNVNPLAFAQNLSRVIEIRGVKIYEKTPLLHMPAKKNIAETPHAKIKFKKIILCIDAATRHSKVKKLNSTIIVTEPLTKKELQHTHLLPKKIVWDSKDVYHYLKITGDNRILLGYGDKRIRKKNSEIDPHHQHLKRITSYLHRLFPYLHKKIDYAWSGGFGVTTNHIPVIERKGSKIIIAGAASQVVCIMAAKHVAHKLLHKESFLDKFFEEVLQS